MILLKNATIFDGENLGTAYEDLLLKDGVVARRGTDLSAEGAEVFDLGGKLVCPGFIDLHVHFRDPGYEWRLHHGGDHAQYRSCGGQSRHR